MQLFSVDYEPKGYRQKICPFPMPDPCSGAEPEGSTKKVKAMSEGTHGLDKEGTPVGDPMSVIAEKRCD